MLKDNPFRVALRAEIPVLQDKTRVTIYHPTFWNAFNHLIPETANGVPEQVVWSDFIARRIFDAAPEQQGVVLNGPVHQGGPATQGLQQLSQSVLNTPLQQGGPAYLGLQPGPQSVFNPPVALGGLPLLQLPFQQVQQQPAVQARQLGVQRSANDLRFPTAEAVQAGVLAAPPGGATPDMMYCPFPGKHGFNSDKWYSENMGMGYMRKFLILVSQIH
jgi:hypothetical protein